MDYVFFAFSALCLGFFVLICFMAAKGGDRKPRLRYMLFAGMAALAYYFLEITLFVQYRLLCDLANLLPQLLLFIALAVYLRRPGTDG
ncbi:MAG TPA: hypothetical protein DD640_04090 [Clostridiales bacterium]|nr:hypothetical protein [Clostridiales bacterium]